MASKPTNEKPQSESETSKVSGAQKSDSSAYFPSLDEKTFAPQKSRFEFVAGLEEDSKGSSGGSNADQDEK